jgi:hypothetical protein
LVYLITTFSSVKIMQFVILGWCVNDKVKKKKVGGADAELSNYSSLCLEGLRKVS